MRVIGVPFSSPRAHIKGVTHLAGKTLPRLSSFGVEDDCPQFLAV